MAKDCSEFEGIEDCYGWSVCAQIEKTKDTDFEEDYPFASGELVVWIELQSSYYFEDYQGRTEKILFKSESTRTLGQVGCRDKADENGNVIRGFSIEYTKSSKTFSYNNLGELVSQSKSDSRHIVNIDAETLFVETTDDSGTINNSSQISNVGSIFLNLDVPSGGVLTAGTFVRHFDVDGVRVLLGTQGAIDYVIDNVDLRYLQGRYVQKYFTFTPNESENRTQYNNPRYEEPYIDYISNREYQITTEPYITCPGTRDDTGLPYCPFGQCEDSTIEFCANNEVKDLSWQIISCNTIGAFLKDEESSRPQIEIKLFDRCHLQRIVNLKAVWLERPCTQITFRRKIKTYELAVVRIVFERIRKLTPTPVSIEIKQVRETYHVFPGRTIQYSNSNAIDEKTITFDRLLGKEIQLFDTQGRALITNSNVNGFIEGSQGKSDIFGNWLISIPFPLTRATVNWRNFSHSDQWEAPRKADIYYYLPNHQPTVNYPDHEIIPTITGGPTEIDPTDLWSDLRTEDFKVADVNGHVASVKLGNWVDVPGSFDQQKRTVEFKNKDNKIIYSDCLNRGSLDRIYYSVDEYEYDNGYCRIFKEEEEECMANFDELKSLLLEIKTKVEKNEERLEAIEGILESVSFPATLWQVPSTGLGDPELGTVNNYTPSSPGLQNTFNQLALVMQGLGRTTAHNKTVVSDVGMAIGVDQWRKEYLKPDPAIVPETFIKRDGKEAKEIKINNLTDLFEWYLKQFDALIGEFSILLEIEQPDGGDSASGSSKPEKLEFFNISETLAEMLGANLNASVNSDLIVNLLSRSLIESGQVKKLAIANSYYLQAIADYLGFEQKHIKKEVPFSFTPKAKSLAELVKEEKIPLDLVKFSGKDNLQVVLLNLLQGAAVSRSGSWRSLKNIADAASVAVQIKDIIKSHQGNAKSIGEDGSIDDLKDFALDVESGFIDDEGIIKSVYGEKDESPEVRVIPPKKQEEKKK